MLIEAERGDPEAARMRLDCLNDIPVLRITDQVETLADFLLSGHAVPEKANADAVHIAAAAIHRMDYLLT